MSAIPTPWRCRVPYNESPQCVQWAAARGKGDTVAKLEEWSAGEDDTQALLQAAQKGSVPRIQALLKRRVSPNLTDENGHTGLMVAAREGHTEALQVFDGFRCNVGVSMCVQILLMVAGDVNAKSHTGRTAVMWAAAVGHNEGLGHLLEYGKTPQ